jgi:hypothetical protein
MKDLAIDLLLWCLASPILLVKWGFRTSKQIRFWITAYTPYIPCRNCGSQISLVGIWKCGCGYTSRSHLLRPCPVCASTPKIVRCGTCSVTTLLPEER